MTWLHQIPSDGTDPRAWPVVYSYSGAYDPVGNGYFELVGEFQLTAFGEIRFNKHKVYSRSLGDWLLKHDTDWYVQRGPDVPAPISRQSPSRRTASTTEKSTCLSLCSD